MSELKEGTVYLIRNIYEKNWHYEGKFTRYETNISNKLCMVFRDVNVYTRREDVKHNHYCGDNYKCFKTSPYVIFHTDVYEYYDYEKVKNGQNAIQNRERRTINMIIRRFIGDETFEWL